MRYSPRYTLAFFIVTAAVGVAFIASANRTHDETGGLVLGERVEDPLGDASLPEGADVVLSEPVQLPENLIKQAGLPSVALVVREQAVADDEPQRPNETLIADTPIRLADSIQGAHTNPNGKKVIIRLKSQTIEMFENGTALHSFKISSGKRGMQTPTGTFAVLNKSKRAYSSTYGLYMPYWMAFTTRGHGIHELPEWPNGYKEGENHLGTPVSHGCVRLGVGSAKTVFDWAEVGTPVEVVQS